MLLSHVTSLTNRVWYLLALGFALLATRSYQLTGRTLYWDDLIIPAKFSPLSPTGLFQLHDNHLIPGAALVQTLVAKAFPLQWLPPALIILTLTLVSFLLWAITLARLLPNQPRLQLLGVTLICFSPFLMDAAGWWSAAMNAYPWQCACAVVLFCMLNDRPSWAAAGLFGGLLFTEKALTILPVVAVVLWIRQQPISWRRFTLPALTLVAWLAWYLPRLDFSTNTTFINGIDKALFQAIIPGAIGGPWQWQRWAPSKAIADPNPVICVLALVVAAAFLYLFAFRRPHRLWFFIPAIGYLIAIWLMLLTARVNTTTTDLLLRSLHYYADWWTFVVLIVLASTRQQEQEQEQETTPKRQPLLAVSCVFAVAAMANTYTWTTAWHGDMNQAYLAGVRHSLATSPAPVLDQHTALEVLTPLAHPYNKISSITGTPAVNVTTHPQVFDAQGILHPAEVAPISYSKLGPEQSCGYRVMAGETVEIPVDPLLQFGDWVWELNALASADGMTVTVTTPNALEPIEETNSRAITVAVPTTLERQWARLPGGSNRLKIEVTGPNPKSSVCIGKGAIGPLVPTD